MRSHQLAKLVRLEDRLAPAIINFNITTATSSLALSGSVAGAAAVQQGAGSLTTTYFGTSQVDVDLVNNTITAISAGSAANANVNGNWQPLVGGATGTAPADYGGKVSIPILPPVIYQTAYFALRGLVGSLTSSPSPLTGSGATRTFPSTQTFTITAGTVDYNAGAIGTGTNDLTGSMATNQAVGAGSITINSDGTCSLAVPIDVIINDTVSGQPAMYEIKGQLNGTASLPVVDLNGAAAGYDSTFTFTAAGAAAKIAPAATITRSPVANLAGMTVTLAAPPDGAMESLAADLSGTSLTTTGYDSSTGTLKINGSANLATYQSVLQKVTYSDAKSIPTAGSRTVTVVVNDGTNDSFVRTAAGTVVTPPAKVGNVIVGDGTTQRSRITQLKVAFDQHVTLPGTAANAFTLVRQLDSMAVGLAGAVDNSGVGTVVTLIFSSGPVDFGSLADGRYTLKALAAQINGGNFDGNGDGMAGDDYQLVGAPGTAPNLFRLYGDSDGNGTVNNADFLAFRSAFGGTSTAFDFNNNGSVDNGDFLAFRSRFGSSI